MKVLSTSRINLTKKSLHISKTTKFYQTSFKTPRLFLNFQKCPKNLYEERKNRKTTQNRTGPSATGPCSNKQWRGL